MRTPGARLTLAVVLLSAPIAPAAPQGSVPWECGDLAPFRNACEDPLPKLYVAGALPEWNVFGFVGRVDIVLTQRFPFGFVATRSWSCSAVASGSLGAECQGPTMTPSWADDLLKLYPAELDCFAWPHPSFGSEVIPPVGPWGCKVLPP